MLSFIKNHFFKNKNRTILTLTITLFIILFVYQKFFNKENNKVDTSFLNIYLENESNKLLRKNNKVVKVNQIDNKTFNDILSSKVENNEKTSKGEAECKRVLKKIFNKPFTKIRPDFLKNDITGGNNLELDCYNNELKLAVEYNGEQHYNYNKFFHKNKESFYNQKYRDELKRRMCKDNGISLIEVPYSVKIKDIENFIKSKI